MEITFTSILCLYFIISISSYLYMILKNKIILHNSMKNDTEIIKFDTQSEIFYKALFWIFMLIYHVFTFLEIFTVYSTNEKIRIHNRLIKYKKSREEKLIQLDQYKDKIPDDFHTEDDIKKIVNKLKNNIKEYDEIIIQEIEYLEKH